MKPFVDKRPTIAMPRSEVLRHLMSQCSAGHDVAGLVDAFLAALPAFGFHSAAGGAWTGMGERRAYRFYFNNWPADWLSLYNEQQVFFDDPMVLEAQRRMTPFLWGDLAAHRALGERSAELLKLGYSYGWADGLVIPIHGPAGYQGMVSMAAMRPLDLTPDEIMLLWVVSLAIHARCRETPDLGEGSPKPPALTKREAECMRWIASGKTDWEVAQLLSISPATVHFHVEKVKRRLATSRRTEAVALLMLHGAL